MDEFNERLEKIRGLLVKMKAKEYAVTNETLSGLDEYVKKLYLKLLGTVIQYKNDPSDMQIIYLNRIACGMGAEEPVEELMRMALEISETDAQEFLSVVKEKNIKFYFALDSLLLLKMGNEEKVNYEYLGELLELCDVTKNDIESVSLIAKSVLLQESSYYDEAKKWIAEYAKTYDFSSYIKTYYAGAIVDLQDKKRYSSPDVNQVYDISFPTLYEEKKVVFENLNIYLNEEWIFEGCEEVVFRDCKIYGEKEHFTLNNIKRVRFENCNYENFSNRVAIISPIEEFVVKNCEFKNCGHTVDYHKWNNSWVDKRDGGVFLIQIDRDGNCNVEVSENSLIKCYKKTENNHYDDRIRNGIFIGFDLIDSGILARGGAGVNNLMLKNNIFLNCEGYGYGEPDAVIDGRLEAKNIQVKNNQSTGEVKRMFKEDDMKFYKKRLF